MMDDIVEDVGKENIVQVVTRNAANYKAASRMLMGKKGQGFIGLLVQHTVLI